MLSGVSARVQSPRIAQQGALARAGTTRDRSTTIINHHRRRRCGSSSSSSPRPLLLLRASSASAPPAAAAQRRLRRDLPSPPLRPLSSPPRATRRERGDDDDDNDDDGSDSLSALAASVTRSWLFRVPLQGTVALIVLAAVDAAYSGDWSRIGAISKETEEALKPLVVALGAFHLVCAGVAGVAASRKGNSVPKAVAKAALVGFLAATEAVYAAEGEGEG